MFRQILGISGSESSNLQELTKIRNTMALSLDFNFFFNLHHLIVLKEEKSRKNLKKFF